MLFLASKNVALMLSDSGVSGSAARTQMALAA
jgi:hypothetical protein